jgi:undecaprenyl phosphate N,N'-diacetylbacillosamine 1-phosphate transferase
MNMKRKFRIYRDFVKSFLDYGIAIIAFIILLPLFIVIMLILSIVNNGKPFFLQARNGKGGRVFHVIKFKTMNDRKDKQGNLLPDVERLTAVGNFIRKTSLDELPQLLNVVKGDMSLIGPRPFVAAYYPLYSDIQKQRFLVKPGITGWAQVNGRNTITWTKRLKYDVWYAQHVTLMLDFKIVLMTMEKIFNHSDVNQADGVTSEPFNSYN